MVLPVFGYIFLKHQIQNIEIYLFVTLHETDHIKLISVRCYDLSSVSYFGYYSIIITLPDIQHQN